jgi:hypothetical protein
VQDALKEGAAGHRREALLAAVALTAFFAAIVAYEALWLASL